MYKFSGEYVLDLFGEDTDVEYSNLVGELENINEAIDFDYDIVDQVEEFDSYKELKDGVYHVYFSGTLDFSTSYNWEYGVYDYDPEIVVDYVNFKELSVNEANI